MKIVVLLLSLILSLNLSAQEKSKTPKIVLNHSNSVVLDTSVNKRSMSDLSMELAELAIKRGSAEYPIYLVINSPGGSIMSGLKFIEFARHFSNVHTITIYAASMAAYIAQAMPGKRYILGTGNMMFHRASISNFGGQIVYGEFESQYQHVKKMVLSMEKQNANRIGISIDEYKKRSKDEWWLWGAEAVSRKTADEVADVLCTPALIKDVKTIRQRTIFGTIKVKRSACPTI